MKKRVFLLTLFLCIILPGLFAQDRETTRKLWDTAFIDQPAKRPSTGAAKGRRYRIATPNISPAQVAGDTVVGITLWRLRPSRTADTGERILVQEGSESADWIPERVEADTKLTAGTRVRLSVEAARQGYVCHRPRAIRRRLAGRTIPDLPDHTNQRWEQRGESRPHHRDPDTGRPSTLLHAQAEPFQPGERGDQRAGESDASRWSGNWSHRAETLRPASGDMGEDLGWNGWTP